MALFPIMDIKEIECLNVMALFWIYEYQIL